MTRRTARRPVSVHQLPAIMRTAAKTATAKGWVIYRTRSGHLAWTPPVGQGRTIFCPSTPSCSRSWANVRGQLRRADLPV
ncbi:hypothetical protein ACMATS_06385 [Streptoverticillium reticulum]|uniref:hypothetical protein n=1 Tax=Streptoverticillium reticulum TaxID=1433415 RepID=UPI0039BF854D